MPDPDPKLDPENQEPDNADDLDEEDDEDDEYDKEDEEEEEDYDDVSFEPATPRAVRLKMDALVRRMLTGPVLIHVHDVIIKGNTKTKGYIIEAEALEALKKATTMQELLQASNAVNSRLKSLGLFNSVKITLDSGPPEIPGSANVVIEVEEARNRLLGEIGAYTKTEAKSSSVEGSINYRNLLGYGDLWDGSIAYGFDHSAEVSGGVYFPRFKALVAPVTARAYILTQDWLNFYSYKERSVGLSLGLCSNRYHNLEYHLAWQTLADASQLSSLSIRSELGHNLLSSLKYRLKIDRRNSPVRPTRGYAFVATTQIGGLAPDSHSLRFLRQEFDLRCAIPLGFYNAAFNFGISTGVIFPWGNGFLNKTTSLPERFFLGGNLSPVCALGGPKALWGFKTRGVGPCKPTRQINDEDADAVGRDFLGGNLAVTALADLSFDLPPRWFREKGIHAHVFACAGNVAKLAENYRSFSVQKFIESFRSSVGVGIVVPTSLFCMELNYCYILKKFDHDHAKAGFWLTFSRPS